MKVGEDLGSKPAFNLTIVVFANGGDREAEDWSRMLGEYPGDIDDALAFLAGEGIVGDEVERRGAPEWTPPAGDGLRAGAILSGEKRDDGAQDSVGEAVDEIEPHSIAGAAAPRWFLAVQSIQLTLLGGVRRRRRWRLHSSR
jgi:hypothetical protein